MIASVCGVVERVNKLISVRPYKSRYVPKIGDVVIGRVTDLNAKGWKMDVGGYLDASLGINSIILPGGENRRRTDADILQMRNIFVEYDLISAEVQQVDKMGSVALHTRSPRYGKLTNGVLVQVPCVLVKRLKQHFVNLDCGVCCIIGNNGFIWVRDTMEEGDQNINNSSSVEIDRQKKEYSEKVIGPEVQNIGNQYRQSQ
ncbi:exosome complex exonuclease RRP4 [Blastocystis sp. subtype 4]|uniref:exosome complex exonuclease RRP4 n=1 Tax=Blastocystis sp. subtype 4 TaxID=944170 RepID=UPI000711FC55|nr:exosome complex exonuclease RRP4 [Blastocystis sp. subtype 4]KNB43996.1 exosome complex exonuclease RRP4 [Blastocystis sp. subtype 4]|eukprot:XP_014527439.1 exosome complex exonuclease RRP4 [Blastocystis sp. subtype 4]